MALEAIAKQEIVIARELLLSLPNSTLSEIVREANKRLHFDPVTYLPQEIVSFIFEYADANTLITAALVSKAWKQRVTEPRLWKRLFMQQGWLLDHDYVQDFEANARRQIRSLRLGYEGRSDQMLTDHTIKQDPVLQRIQEQNGPVRLWMKNRRLGVEKQSPAVEQRELQSDNYDRMNITTEDEVMNDAMDTQGAQYEMLDERVVHTPLLGTGDLLDPGTAPAFDWQYLFKQRKRLEDNWDAGRYTNFRLPRHDHPEEAHTQCVYTMQFSPKHVVSGSRDRTIRIWNLETKRLRGKPLIGHEGSVLCLQFDESPNNDIIASGGSDSHVIIWTFSTGQILKTLKNAHAESVLNLRFDHRYLITCSKDKTIKLWNRRSLLPTDPEYPRKNGSKDALFPEHIISMEDMVNSTALSRVPPLEPFSLLMTFIGHNAAVNAIQVCDDEIVSASGDRKIFLWSIKTGELIRQFAGHGKGIACVQYDGKRIVSGSSDRTIRVFDASTGAQLAFLEGHRDLVRTVQADFADAPGSDLEYEAQAKAYGRKVLKMRQQHPTQEGGREVHVVLGAKLPPGGGGNQYSKIVSGSYDETVMIWKKAKNGKWVVAKELRQEDAMRVTGGLPTPSEHRRGHRAPTPAEILSMAQQPQSRDRRGTPDHLYEEAMPLRQSATSQADPIVAGPSSAAGDPASTSINASTLQTHIPAHMNPQHPHFGYTAPPRQSIATERFRTRRDARQSTAQATDSLPPTHAPTTSANPDDSTTRQIPSDITTHALAQSTAQSQTRPQAPGPPPSAANAPAQMRPAGPRHHHHHRAMDDADLIGASRVFKLQFNARYIICCSQQSVIVGWDFANGDRDLEEASSFFGMLEGS